MTKIRYLNVKRLLLIGFFKTLYINFRKLPFYDAIKLPIIVSKKTKFNNIDCEITINGPISSGMITIGFAGDDFSNPQKNWSFLNLRGKVVFNGKANFGVGSTLFVGKQAILIFGNDFTSGHQTKIICYEQITFGKTVRLAWESQVFDTNFHYIENLETKEITSKNQPVTIGNYCWIGNRTSIMKGTVLNDGTIVTSNSICNRDYSALPNNSIIGGSPAKLIKSGFLRVFDVKKEIELNAKFGFEK